jgi:hypothetical protein
VNWIFETADNIFGLLNPWNRGRQIYVYSRKGWRKLLSGLSPETRFLLLSAFFWFTPMALTEPYKSLYLTKLGLDSFALGRVNGLDMGLRSLGLVLGGWLGLRFGHKRTLQAGDLISWVLSSLVLALATKPSHVVLWAVLMSTNSLVAASYQHLVLKGTPKDSRVGAYGFINLSVVLPMLLLPWISSWLLGHYDFVMTMRALFILQSLSMAGGVLLRGLRLQPDHPQAGAQREPLLPRAREVLGSIFKAPHCGLILGVWVASNIAANLWRVYFSLYAVEQFGCPEASLGYYSQAGSLVFVVASLFLLPRLSVGQRKRAFWMANAASLVPAFLLFSGRGAWPMALVSTSAGAVGALQGAMMASLLAGLLPESELALAFALCQGGLQVLIGASFPLAGALFQGHLLFFAFSNLTLCAVDALLAYGLWKAAPAG